jgi:hypothetical protein
MQKWTIYFIIVDLFSFKGTGSLTIYGNDWNRWTQIILLLLSFYVTRIKIIRNQSSFSMMRNQGYLDSYLIYLMITDFVKTFGKNVTSQVVGFWWRGQFCGVLRGYGILWQWWGRENCCYFTVFNLSCFSFWILLLVITVSIHTIVCIMETMIYFDIGAFNNAIFIHQRDLWGFFRKNNNYVLVFVKCDNIVLCWILRPFLFEMNFV